VAGIPDVLGLRTSGRRAQAAVRPFLAPVGNL
jgi:hypothetical protein